MSATAVEDDILLKPVTSVPVPGVVLLDNGFFRVGDSLHCTDGPTETFDGHGVRVHKTGTGAAVLIYNGRSFWLRHQDKAWYLETSLAEELAAGNTPPFDATPLPRSVPKPPAPVPTTAVPPVATRSLAGRVFGFLWSVKATLLLLFTCGAVYGVWAAGTTRQLLLEHATFTESHWNTAQYHVILTHGFLNERAGELGVWLVGILLFGMICETNIGSLRTVLLACFCSAMGVLGYALFNTADGFEWTLAKAGRLYWWIFEKWGYEKAQMFSDAFNSVVPMMAWSTPLYSSAALCGGLITFAVCRRTSDDGIGVRRWNLLLAVAFLGVALAVCWPRVVGTPIPYVLLFGGALGGLAYIFPDKAIDHLAEWLRERRTS